MDGTCGWEQSALVNELTQGMEIARQLKFHLNSETSSETQSHLLQSIMSSYEKALSILRWSGPEEPHCPAPPATACLTTESSISIDGSPRSEDFDKVPKDYQPDHRDASKKRKMLPTWTDRLRICPDNGVEGPVDDGYSWRKYGQKDILGAKYPRSYFRCTYRGTQNCWATKQVQRSDEDPSVFEITYKGNHTCSQQANNNHSAPPPTTSVKQEEGQNNMEPQGQLQENVMLNNLRANLRVSTNDLDNKEEVFNFSRQMIRHNSYSYMDSYSPSFVSPTNSDMNYFSPSPFQRNQSDITEIISANTSATNSPIPEWDFSAYPVHPDQSFPFDIHGYFT